MPLNRESLSTLKEKTFSNYMSLLRPLDKTPRYNILKVLAFCEAGAQHQLLGDIDFLSEQLFPDTASGDYLRMHWSDRVAPLYAGTAAGTIIQKERREARFLQGLSTHRNQENVTTPTPHTKSEATEQRASAYMQKRRETNPTLTRARNLQSRRRFPQALKRKRQSQAAASRAALTQKPTRRTETASCSTRETSQDTGSLATLRHGQSILP